MGADPRQVARLAALVKHGETSVRLPPSGGPLIQTGILAGVDRGRNTSDLLINEPSGLVIPGVRVMQMYSATNLPQVNDVVKYWYANNTMHIMGKLIVPDDFIVVT